MKKVIFYIVLVVFVALSIVQSGRGQSQNVTETKSVAQGDAPHIGSNKALQARYSDNTASPQGSGAKELLRFVGKGIGIVTELDALTDAVKKVLDKLSDDDASVQNVKLSFDGGATDGFKVGLVRDAIVTFDYSLGRRATTGGLLDWEYANNVTNYISLAVLINGEQVAGVNTANGDFPKLGKRGKQGDWPEGERKRRLTVKVPLEGQEYDMSGGKALTVKITVHGTKFNLLALNYAFTDEDVEAESESDPKGLFINQPFTMHDESNGQSFSHCTTIYPEVGRVENHTPHIITCGSARVWCNGSLTTLKLGPVISAAPKNATTSGVQPIIRRALVLDPDSRHAVNASRPVVVKVEPGHYWEMLLQSDHLWVYYPPTISIGGYTCLGGDCDPSPTSIIYGRDTLIDSWRTVQVRTLLGAIAKPGVQVLLQDDKTGRIDTLTTNDSGAVHIMGTFGETFSMRLGQNDPLLQPFTIDSLSIDMLMDSTIDSAGKTVPAPVIEDFYVPARRAPAVLGRVLDQNGDSLTAVVYLINTSTHDTLLADFARLGSFTSSDFDLLRTGYPNVELLVHVLSQHGEGYETRTQSQIIDFTGFPDTIDVGEIHFDRLPRSTAPMIYYHGRFSLERKKDSLRLPLSNFRVEFRDTIGSLINQVETDSNGMLATFVPNGVLQVCMPGLDSIDFADSSFAGRHQCEQVDFGIGGDTLDIGQRVALVNSFGRKAQLSVVGDWNMVSSPVRPSNDTAAILFPGAASAAFWYAGASYQVAQTLAVGNGYWLRFGSPATVTMFGTTIDSLAIAVKQGWNMIGAISHPIAVGNITSLPSGLMVSQFFQYDSAGYAVADSIRPGVGYWVNVHQDGQLVLSTLVNQPSANRVIIVADGELPPLPPGLRRVAAVLKQFALRQNYPNPFNPLSVIEFDLPQEALVTLKIFNLLGREIVTLKNNERYEAGTHQVQFDAATLSSGLYFYRLLARSEVMNFVEVKKMLLIK